MTTLFITGIDTGVGKSYACGALANSLIKYGHHLYTQKLVETGCAQGYSNDLLQHQKMVGFDFNQGQAEQHSPYCFTFTASPHLSAELEGIEINVDYLVKQTKSLSKECEHLLIEGAGGMCVPLNKKYMIIDVLTQQQLPIVMVTSGKLGSINHTILSLELCQSRGVEVRAVIYNHYPDVDKRIFNNTRETLQAYLHKTALHKTRPSTLWLELEKDSASIELSSEQVEQLLGYFDNSL